MTAAIPNGVGVVIDSDTNIVGSLAAAEPNVISGNTDSNLTVFGNSFIVEGNRIGSDLAGENASMRPSACPLPANRSTSPRTTSSATSSAASCFPCAT